jgi:hypothetical protein
MAEFVINQDVVTEVPTVEVTVTPNNPLPVGRQRFRLIVADNSGLQSAPDEVIVIIADQEAPTAVLGRLGIIPFGRSFDLDGRASFDVGGGRVVRYTWTYLGPERLG